LIIILNIQDENERAKLATVLTMLSVFILAGIWLSHTVCRQTTEVLLRDNKRSGNIIRRSYGCGAHDSSLPEYELYQLTPITGFLSYVEKLNPDDFKNAVWVQQSE
jgi:hypothetical protein